MVKTLKLILSSVLMAIIALIFINASKGVSMNNDTDCRIANTAIKGGERIVYKAYYNWKFIWVPAGEAVFNIKENKDTYVITVVGKTYNAYDPFFKVRDYFYSEIDKNTMYPRNFVRIVEEGDYRKFDSLSFNQHSRYAVSYNGKTRETAQKKYIATQDCTHDLLSVLYFMRNTQVSQYKAGDYIPTRILFDETIYPIKVRYDGQIDNFDIKNLGTFDVIKVIPDLVTGTVFKDGNKMNIYVSNDGNKLPLLIESPLKVGTAKAVLKSYSGLRYQLEKK